jgi:hypothetical protein
VPHGEKLDEADAAEVPQAGLPRARRQANQRDGRRQSRQSLA